MDLRGKYLLRFKKNFGQRKIYFLSERFFSKFLFFIGQRVCFIGEKELYDIEKEGQSIEVMASELEKTVGFGRKDRLEF